MRKENMRILCAILGIVSYRNGNVKRLKRNEGKRTISVARHILLKTRLCGCRSIFLCLILFDIIMK